MTTRITGGRLFDPANGVVDVVRDLVIEDGRIVAAEGPAKASDEIIDAAGFIVLAGGIDLSTLNFRYRIDGDRTPWRPARAFDDGRQVFIEFPAGISQGEMPPLFVSGASGEAELVNYRVQGRYMVVDRLFAAAELRLGDRRTAQRVRIVRTDGRERRP